MTPIVVDATRPAPAAAREMQWTQPHWSRPEWELHEGEKLWVTLRRVHWYGGTLLAHIEGTEWHCMRHDLAELRLIRPGADQPEMSIRPYWWPSDEDTERLRLSRWRGDAPIERADGRRWFWRQHGFWRNRYWEVLDEKECAIVMIRRRRRVFRIEGMASFGAGVPLEDGLHAAVFGWYLLLREAARRHHAAAAGAG